MSLKPQEVNPIPEETIRVAHAAFPKGNALMRLRDLLGPIYTDAQFTALFPHDGQPALSPGRLALVSVLQFAEGLVFSAGRRCGTQSDCLEICTGALSG